MTAHRIGTRKTWLAARRELLDAEKKHMRQGDELARRRLELPWVPIEKEYVFETDDGKKTLPELFDGRSQLLVYHFMFGFGLRVDERNPGSTGCSFVADHFDGVVPHLNGHDVTLVAESIAPLEELHPYKRRMGWKFPWVSSLGSGFKYDFGAAFTEEQQRNGGEYNLRNVDQPPPQREGMSAFALKDGLVHQTYSTYDRGVEQLMGPTACSTWRRSVVTRKDPRPGGTATTSTRRRIAKKTCAAAAANVIVALRGRGEEEPISHKGVAIESDEAKLRVRQWRDRADRGHG